MKPKKILLVDDEEIIRSSLAREIRLASYDIDTVEDGDKALAQLLLSKYDLVITDLRMPGTSGIGVLQAVKREVPETSVIILTGHGDMNSAIEALRHGADDFLHKPCETEELLFRMAKCLEKQSLLRQLAKQNQRLKLAMIQQQKMKQKIRRNEERFRLALDASSDGLWEVNLLSGEEYFGENWHRTLGFEDNETQSPSVSWTDIIHPEDKKSALSIFQEHIAGRTPRYEAEFRLKNKQGGYQWVLSRGKVVAWDKQGKPLRFIGTYSDISRLKDVEMKLQQARGNLEKQVEERTTELEESNVALRVLLKKREEDKSAYEQQIASNISKLIEPYLLKLAASQLSSRQRALLDILQANLQELCSSFAKNLSAGLIRFTPTEIQVANLIKQGKRTKDIAEMMNLSPGTINIHRKNIRKKLDLTHKKVNLQSTLSTYS